MQENDLTVREKRIVRKIASDFHRHTYGTHPSDWYRKMYTYRPRTSDRYQKNVLLLSLLLLAPRTGDDHMYRQPTGHIGSCHYEGGYIKYMTWCQPYVIHVKRLLRVHTQCLKREYCWEFVVWLQLSILHPNNTKLGKFGNFRSL